MIIDRFLLSFIIFNRKFSTGHINFISVDPDAIPLTLNPLPITVPTNPQRELEWETHDETESDDIDACSKFLH